MLQNGLLSTRSSWLTLTRALRLAAYALVLTPLVYWRPLMFFFEETKGFYVALVALFLLLLFGWFLYAQPAFRPRLGMVGVALMSFVAILFATSLLGTDFVVSFWGEADRVTALFYWLHLAVVFVVLVNVFQTRKDWTRFLSASVIVALLVAFVQLLFVLDLFEISASRNGATLGNSTYLAVYLLYHVFFALFIATSSTQRSRKLFGYVSAGLFGLSIVLPNDTHAVTFSLFGALIFFVAVALLWGARKRWHAIAGWSILGGLIGLVVLTGIMLARPQSALREYAIDISSGARFVVWDIAWQGIKERPVVGWGLENFPRVFFDHYNPCLGSPACGGEMFYDRAHNKVLDVWIESGIVGLLAYVVLFLMAIRALFQIAHTQGGTLPASVLFALLAGYFVQNLTVLDVSTSLLFFTITLALIQSLSLPSRERSSANPFFGRPMVVVLATMAFLSGGFFFVVQPVRASIAVATLNAGVPAQERAELYDRVANGSPYGQRVRRSYIAFTTLSWLVKNGRAAVEQDAAYIRQEIRRNQVSLIDQLERTDFDPRLYTLLGAFYQIEGRLFDGVGYEQARQTFEQGIARHPFNPKPAWALLSLHLELGEFEQATVLAQAVVDLVPGSFEAGYNQLVVEKFVAVPQTFKQRALEVREAFPAGASKIDQLISMDVQKDRDDLLHLPGRF